MRNAVARLYGIGTAADRLNTRTSRMKMRNRTKCITAGTVKRSEIFPVVYRLLLAAVAGLAVTPSVAQSVAASENMPMAGQQGEPETPGTRSASLSIASVAEAERLLKDVEVQRESINARYKDEEAQCFTRFFVTSCIDDAKERRRVGLRSIRYIEVQANAFKRAYRADQRDRDLQQKKPTELPKPDVPRSEDLSRQPLGASKFDLSQHS